MYVRSRIYIYMYVRPVSVKVMSWKKKQEKKKDKEHVPRIPCSGPTAKLSQLNVTRCVRNEQVTYVAAAEKRRGDGSQPASQSEGKEEGGWDRDVRVSGRGRWR